MSEPVTKSRHSIAEEAAEWFVQLREKPPGRSTKNKFVAWLTESPVHVEEYLAIAKVFGDLQHVDPQGRIEIDKLVDETVVAMHGDVHADNADKRPVSRKGWNVFGLAASALLAIVTASVLYVTIHKEPLQYSTALGEQRSVLLEDGSMVSLNTSSRIEVALTDANRQVRLIRGEALFDVEEDAARPFLVETSSALIRVTGTQFNVYEQGDVTAVTVLKGEVEVTPRNASPAASAASTSVESTRSGFEGTANLTVGDQAVVKSGSVEIETRTVENLEPVTAWTERRLVFDSTPLSEIVKQFNRYNHERLVLDDPALQSLELSGVFSSNDPESLVLFLERIVDVDAVTSADGKEIRIRASNATR